MQSSHFIGSVPSVVHRLILTEGSPITLPSDYVRLYSEVVVSDGQEVLELWIAAPAVNQVDTSPSQHGKSKTIYSSTVVHDEDKNFAMDIEDSVNRNLEDYEGVEEWSD